MYNKLEIENAEISFERDLIFVFLNVLISAILLGICAMFYKSFSSWFFLLIIPSGFFPFHTLWILLNPFAKIYKNRIEIRPTFFRSQIFYFNDIQQLKNDKKGKYYMIDSNNKQYINVHQTEHIINKLKEKDFWNRL